MEKLQISNPEFQNKDNGLLGITEGIKKATSDILNTKINIDGIEYENIHFPRYNEFDILVQGVILLDKELHFFQFNSEKNKYEFIKRLIKG